MVVTPMVIASVESTFQQLVLQLWPRLGSRGKVKEIAVAKGKLEMVPWRNL